MKVILLAGGFGTRISEESQFKPKPMIEIGGKPILWHIMKEYAYYGFDEFIICAGYKQYVIKEWFADYFLHNSDITFDFTKGSNDMIIHEQHCEPWKVTVVDTGLNTMTGGRIKRIQKYVGDEPFLMTYGDGVCDVDMNKLVEFHKEHGKIATLTAVILVPPTEPNLFSMIDVEDKMNSVIGDIRDLEHLKKVFEETQPEIVLHLAAQPIVRESYKDPVYTYETNVMGTVNICECVRLNPCVKSFLNVTTDKVYHNNEWAWGYRENEPLDGYDPYSNSKSCSELVTHSYINSFFNDMEVAVSTARAGNVIGGGDFANDRIVPDCVRAAVKKEDIIVRNPHSTRPYQHVLEPLAAYLMIAKEQYSDKKYAGFYNVGPDESDCITTGTLVNTFCNKWGEGLSWINKYDGGPHEANFLKLDCSKLKTTFGWKPRWNFDTAIEKSVEWSKVYAAGGDVVACMDKEIEEFFA